MPVCVFSGGGFARFATKKPEAAIKNPDTILKKKLLEQKIAIFIKKDLSFYLFCGKILWCTDITLKKSALEYLFGFFKEQQICFTTGEQK